MSINKKHESFLEEFIEEMNNRELSLGKDRSEYSIESDFLIVKENGLNNLKDCLLHYHGKATKDFFKFIFTSFLQDVNGNRYFDKNGKRISVKDYFKLLLRLVLLDEEVKKMPAETLKDHIGRMIRGFRNILTILVNKGWKEGTQYSYKNIKIFNEVIDKFQI